MRFVISRFCSIHFTVILAGLKKIVRFTEDFSIQRFVKSRSHCKQKRHFETSFFAGFDRC